MYAELVEDAGSAIAVLDEEQAGQTSLFAAGDLAETDAQIDGWRDSGLQLLTILDSEYPENLRGVHDRPPLIFVSGRLEPSDARAVAVVGARAASSAATNAAGLIAAHLVQAGFTVFSGLAAGIDTAAHTAALAQGGRTVAVIGTGINRVYPPQNAQLQRQIAAQCAVVSQFWPDAPPTRRSFPMRNAVMSGLTLATVVVEASDTSGARPPGAPRARPGAPGLPARVGAQGAMGQAVCGPSRGARRSHPARDHHDHRAAHVPGLAGGLGRAQGGRADRAV